MNMTDTHKWQMLALAVVIGAVCYLLAPVLTPFAIAALVAYLGDPMVDRLERYFSRSFSVTLVFLLFTLAALIAVVLLVPLIERQVGKLIEQFPRYVTYVQEAVLPWIEQTLDVKIDRLDPGSLISVVKGHWQQAGGFASAVLGGISKSGLAVLAWIANIVLLPVLIFYLLRDWDILVERIRELVPRTIEPVVSRLARESDEVLGGFLRGQLSVMFVLGTIYAVGLWLVGLDVGLLIGMLAGIVSFIPYLGAIVGVGAGVIAALVQFGDISSVVLVLIVFAVGQTVESFLLTPWLVGDKIGLHPVAVIFAIMAGGQLFGFFGVLLALPVAAVVMVLLRYGHERYTQSGLYGGAVASAALAASGSPESGAGRAEPGATSASERESGVDGSGEPAAPARSGPTQPPSIQPGPASPGGDEPGPGGGRTRRRRRRKPKSDA